MNGLSLIDLPPSDKPTAVLAHCPAAVAGLPITVMPIVAQGEVPHDMFSLPRIFVAQQGAGDRWYQLGGKTRALKTAPRMIEVYEGGMSFDHCSWAGEAGRSVLVEFPDADVQALTHGRLQRLELQTRHGFFDERIASLVLGLADEALKGLPNGRLYVEGLCVSLLGLLVNGYAVSTPAPSPARAGQLGALQQRRLGELIAGQLGADLSLARLAAEVGLSPQHFARVFKATYGVTPHRHVRQRRLEAAMAALRRNAGRSISEIALEHGFASQAHMTELMRRSFGVTPREWRRRA